jgi:chromodomain-helicase-DNA-binding protein 4
MVYQFVCRLSVEEKIVVRAQEKLMLEHLVVRKMKDEFKEGELDDILKYGAKELFAEDNKADGDGKGTSFFIVVITL